MRRPTRPSDAWGHGELTGRGSIVLQLGLGGKARRGLCIPVCAAEQWPALPPSGRGGHREASRARRLGGCQVPGHQTPGIRWVGGFGTHCWQCYPFLQPCTLRKPLSTQVCLLHSNQARSWLPHPAATPGPLCVLHWPSCPPRPAPLMARLVLPIPIHSQALGCATLKSTVLQGAGKGCVDTPSLPLLAKKHTSLCLHIALCLQVKVAQIQPSAQFHLSLPVTESTMLSTWNTVLPA